MKHTFTQLNLESRILIISMLTGTLICFASAVGNFFLGLGVVAILIPFSMGALYIYFLHNILIKNNYAFAAYGSLLMLTCLVFPLLWLVHEGLFGSIPYFYVFMIFLTAVVLNKLRYKEMIGLQISVVFFLILIERQYPHLIIKYDSELVKTIDVGSSLIVVILLVFFMMVYIMKVYHQNIVQLESIRDELTQANASLHIHSITDELTSLYNRRFIMNRLSEICELDDTLNTSVIMLDIDHFKNINDTFGHSTGDDVLRRISSLLKTIIKCDHHVSRLGGEEFLIIVKSDSHHIPFKIAEEIRQAIESLNWKNSKLTVTISAGVYTLNNDNDIESILHCVDSALYLAKNSGRNKTCSYSDIE